MFKLPGSSAYEQLTKNIRQRHAQIPPKSDPLHYYDGAIFPPITPKFKLKPHQTVFTIGSCFARNIERVLIENELDVPVARFNIPRTELPHAAPHLLNEYNAGTILQRLEASVGAFDYRPEMGIEYTKDGVIDLFLHIHSAPVSFERLQERRAEIGRLYKVLPKSDAIILTLGLVESWFDSEHDCYLNRAPSRALIRSTGDRFEFHRLDFEDVIGRLRRAMVILRDVGTTNVLLTVSPIPIEATFMPGGAVTANSYSKAVLRVAVETLVREFDFVDYFPSYEIATSFGTTAYLDDNVHLSEAAVEKIVQYMIYNYGQSSSDALQALNSDVDFQAALMGALNAARLDLAEEIGRMMIAAHNDSWRTYDALGHLCSRRGQHDQALVNAERCMALAGRHWEYLARVGQVYEDMGSLEEAEAAYAEAASLPGGAQAADWLQRVRTRRSHLPA